jgi:hypothetical protein
VDKPEQSRACQIGNWFLYKTAVFGSRAGPVAKEAFITDVQEENWFPE